MRQGPMKCIYCLSGATSFSRREHPIPESLGNDDLLLPHGYVCDVCNQYFGSKIESEVLRTAPFGIERVFQAVKSKKRKYPNISDGSLTLRSTGFWDKAHVQSEWPHSNLRKLPNGKIALNPKWSRPNTIARFLIKMGIGLLVVSPDIDPYSTTFDKARNCARLGTLAKDWDFALGIYPRREDLVKLVRIDLLGQLETREIYQYSMGVMQSGDVVFCFRYATSCFAINLSRPSIFEYLLEFNKINSFPLQSRFQAFRS
jgi:hypothetical protein